MPFGINPFSAITSRIFAGTTGVLLVLLALSHCSDKRHTAQRDKARAELDMARRQFAAASEANEQAQREQVAKLEAKLTDAAKESANVESQIRVVYRDRTAAYADRMRAEGGLRCGETRSPGQDQPAPVDNGTREEAILVSRTDLEILAENTARLEAAHRWAKTLLDDGTAEVVKAGVPEVGF